MSRKSLIPFGQKTGVATKTYAPTVVDDRFNPLDFYDLDARSRALAQDWFREEPMVEVTTHIIRRVIIRRIVR